MEVKKDTSTPGTLADEARDLDAELEGRTEEAPANDGASAGQEPAAELEILPLDREVAGLFAVVGAGFGHFFPTVKSVLTDERCLELGGAIAPVLVKWDIAHYFTGFKWREELQAAMTVIPTVVAIQEAIAHDLKVAKEKPVAESPLGADKPVDQPASAHAEYESGTPPVVEGALQPIAK